MQKSCEACNALFIAKTHFAKYCGIECRNTFKLSQPFVCKIHGELLVGDIRINYKSGYVGRTCKHCKIISQDKCERNKPKQYRAAEVKRKKRYRLALTDNYIKHTYFRGMQKYITPELIEAKRLHIKLTRLIKGDGLREQY